MLKTYPVEHVSPAAYATVMRHIPGFSLFVPGLISLIIN
jgi:hypothetical protein